MNAVSDEQPVVHIELKFNGMIMTVSATEDKCHPKARFWLSWDNFPRLEAYLKMNQIEKIRDKKVFGILVASRIVQLRQ